MSSEKTRSGTPSRKGRLLTNGQPGFASKDRPAKQPEMRKKRLMKNERFTVKKGPRSGERAASWMGQSPPVGP